MDDLAHRTHSHYPVCHTLQATKLPSLSVNRLPDRTVYRCASPPLLQHTVQLLDELPDVTSTTDYPVSSQNPTYWFVLTKLTLAAFANDTCLPIA